MKKAILLLTILTLSLGTICASESKPKKDIQSELDALLDTMGQAVQTVKSAILEIVG